MASPRGRAAAVIAGERGVAVGGDVVDSVIITGDHATIELQLGSVDGALLQLLRRWQKPVKRARPSPLDRRPPPFPNHLDRDREAAALVEPDAEQVVNLHGETGIGKTYVLRYALASAQARSLRDGIVYLFAKDRPRADVLQALFEEFFECEPPHAASEAQISDDLAEKEALVVLDSVELEPSEVQDIVSRLPRCRFLVASHEIVYWDGRRVALEGFELADALTLVEQELRRAASAKERPAVEELWRALNGHPGRLRQALGLTLAGRPLPEVARTVAPAAEPAHALAQAVLESLSPSQRRIVDTLTLFGAATVGEERLAELVALPDADAELRELERRHVIESNSPRYRLAGTLAEELASGSQPQLAGLSALRYFTSWAEANREDLRAQVGEAAAVLQLLRWALAHRHFGEAIRLGRAVEAAFAGGRRLGAARQVAESVRVAAAAVGDRGAQAWALHQLGAYLACSGDRRGALEHFRRALRIRRELGDASGAAATRHNLDVLAAPPWLLSRITHLPVLTLAIFVVALIAASAGPATWLATKGDHNHNPPVGFLVSVAREGTGAGTVRSSPAGLDCGTRCTAEFAVGTTVSFEAEAREGSLFASWSGGCSGTAACTIKVDRPQAVRATFTAIRSQSLTIAKTGKGAGTVTSAPAGIDCGTSCAAKFANGAEVTLNAEPGAASAFAGWQGEGCAGRDRCSLRMDRVRRIRARFEPASSTRRVTVQTTGTGSGRILSDPHGIACAPTCVAEFARGTTVTLIARPDPSSAFAGWQGACSGTAVCALMVRTALSVTARFEPIVETRTLTVGKAGDGTGSVTSDPSGIDCGQLCQGRFALKAQVTLTARAEPGSVFVGWSGGGCLGTQPCRLALGADTTVRATFSSAPRKERLTVRKSGNGSGSVTSTPPGIDCGVVCTSAFAVKPVTLAAHPDDGSVFVAWKGGGCSGTGTCSVPLRGPTAVVAVFRLTSKGKTLTIEKAGTGTGYVLSDPRRIACGSTCTATFDSGSKVVLIAKPAFNAIFVGWSGGGCPVSGNCTLTMDADKTVTATFTPLRTLVVKKGGTGDGTVVSKPRGLLCGKRCSAQFREGTVITLVAHADASSLFVRWTERRCAHRLICRVRLDENLTVGAIFTRAYTISIVLTGSGTVTSSAGGIQCNPTCTGKFAAGTTITLTATPDKGWDLQSWSGDCKGSQLTCKLTLDTSKSINVTFGPSVE